MGHLLFEKNETINMFKDKPINDFIKIECQPTA